jgi:hypothetical protein
MSEESAARAEEAQFPLTPESPSTRWRYVRPRNDLPVYRAKPWEEVVEFFAGLARHNSPFEPLHSFVVEVATSRYAATLFPATSMHTLLISQSAQFDRRKEVLEVEFRAGEQKFFFQYWESEGAKKRWSKECEGGAAFRTFERFLELKKWFPERLAPPDLDSISRLGS